MQTEHADHYCISMAYFEDGIKCHGLWHYYHQKMIQKIPNFQHVWSILTYRKTSFPSVDQLNECYQSASEHYGYLLFSREEIIKSETTLPPNNDAVFFISYFFYNFITTAKALCDIFAWIIFYSFVNNPSKKQLDSHITIFFKSYRNNTLKNDNFFNKSFRHNHNVIELYNFISSDIIQNTLSSLEHHRDIIIHKGKLHIAPLTNKQAGESSIKKPINPELFRFGDMSHLGKTRITDSLENCSDYIDKVIKIIDEIFVELNNVVYLKLKN